MRHLLPLILLLSSGCYPPPSITQQIHHHDNGITKPKVAIIKVIDNSNHNLSWDLSSELTEYLIKDLYSRSNFFLTDDFHMIENKHLRNLELSPYSEDMSWLLEMNNSSEFILFTEIISHNITDNTTKTYNPLSYVKSLDIAIRISVLDIRVSKPKIILQEIITKKYPIPFNFGSYDENSSILNKNSFALSPLGIAHKHIISKVSSQIEDYILISKSKD